jgi:site-specific recombinase XerD
MKAREIVNHEPLLFERSLPTNTLMMSWKDYGYPKIQKKVTFHVARHTFATSFFRAGQVEKLKDYWDTDIKQTMIYVHIVQADANAEIFY